MWQDVTESRGGTLFVNTDCVMLFGKEIEDELHATCSMYEENKKYTEEVHCKTLKP